MNEAPRGKHAFFARASAGPSDSVQYPLDRHESRTDDAFDGFERAHEDALEQETHDDEIPNAQTTHQLESASARKCLYGGADVGDACAGSRELDDAHDDALDRAALSGLARDFLGVPELCRYPSGLRRHAL